MNFKLSLHRYLWTSEIFLNGSFALWLFWQIQQILIGSFYWNVRGDDIVLVIYPAHQDIYMCKEASGHVIWWSDFVSLYFTRSTSHIVSSFLFIMQVTTFTVWLLLKPVLIKHAHASFSTCQKCDSLMARFGLYFCTWILDHMPCGFNEALADPGGGRGPGPPLTPRFGGPSYTIWMPSIQFKG